MVVEVVAHVGVIMMVVVLVVVIVGMVNDGCSRSSCSSYTVILL